VSARRGKVAIDRETWRRLLGDRVARRTEPGALRDGVLTIYVASAPWAQELSLLSSALIERLRPLGLKLDSLRFRVRERISSADAVQRRRPAARGKLPPELEQRLASIGDAELRAVIEDAAELWLGRQEKLSAKSTAPSPRSAAARSAPPVKSSPPSSAAARDRREMKPRRPR